jgi:glycosyltransferase involved in cell wall biosynthesis
MTLTDDQCSSTMTSETPVTVRAAAWSHRRHGRLPRVSVVVATADESRTAATVLERLPDVVDELIVVDGSAEADRAAARRAGFFAARGEYIVMIDADASLDPDEIERFVDALRSECDLVTASHLAKRGLIT